MFNAQEKKQTKKKSKYNLNTFFETIEKNVYCNKQQKIKKKNKKEQIQNKKKKPIEKTLR